MLGLLRQTTRRNAGRGRWESERERMGEWRVEKRGRDSEARARLKQGTGSPVQRLAPSASPPSSLAATRRDSLWAILPHPVHHAQSQFSSHAERGKCAFGSEEAEAVSYQGVRRRICRGFSVNGWVMGGWNAIIRSLKTAEWWLPVTRARRSHEHRDVHHCIHTWSTARPLL